MTTFDDVEDAVVHFARAALPFPIYGIGPDGADTIEVTADHRSTTAARTYFASHPVRLTDGTEVSIVVVAIRGASWTSEPHLRSRQCADGR
ncbi:hypothetical protein [Nocardioides abyssi]|uniref:Uncharacterized protein n=1 Tax=Nocardioides abyssi TaxID=3058370 RepID=A0ABT8ESG7_9ACTN|nr:hypothetical protein [Nocardioides abyssi]MDN4161101.1 hypothetical protein [Nocardioides abyssi]